MGLKNLFSQNNYRFGVETMVSIYLSNYQIVLGADLDDYSNRQDFFDDENPCNIYFILRRPKVTIDPESIKIRGKKAKFSLLIHSRERIAEIKMGCEFKKATSKIVCHTEYPYNLFLFRDEDKPLMLARPGTLIDSPTVTQNIDPEELDFEILYIGQSYGATGKRTAIDRLASHETLQKIYAHALTHSPEYDIWVMLTSFSQQSVLLSAGKGIVNVKKNDRHTDDIKVKGFFKNQGINLTERQRINLTEAALIKYFEPEYNLNFKENFPSVNHKSYTDCYKLDIRAINIEIGTREMVRKIYTKKSGRKEYHSKTYEFSSLEDRISFLNFERKSKY